jgi:archaellum component FlaC
MDEILKKLEAIEKRLENIENSIDKINNRLDGVEVNTTMMGNHIHFVEDVYDKVKKPLYYISNRINRMIE